MRRRRGISFVIVLAVLTALVALVAGFAATQRSAVRESIGRGERLRARVLAEAGLQRGLAALALVQQDRTEPTTLSDDWATLGQNGAEEFSLASGSFRLQIVDASGLIDLNTAPEEALTNLGLTTEQVNSLLDWREAATTSNRADGGKDTYYNGLTTPYNARLGRLQTVDELLLVKGFTNDTLYRAGVLNENSTVATGVAPGETERPLADLATVVAYAPNDDPDGDGRLNVNTAANANAIAQRLGLQGQIPEAIFNGRPAGTGYATLGAVLNAPGVAGNTTAVRNILDRLNIVPGDRLEGKVNFNTAPVEVLAAIPGIGADLAQTIVGRQSSSPFDKLSDLVDVSSQPQFTQAIATYAATRSASFLVRSVGKAGSTTIALTATVVLADPTQTAAGAGQAAPARLLRVEEAPFGDMPTRWGWDDVTTTTSLQEATTR